MTTSPRRMNSRPSKRPSRLLAATPKDGMQEEKTPTKKTHYAPGPARIAMLTALGIIALAGVSFALIRETAGDGDLSPNMVTSDIPAFFSHPEFQTWFRLWKDQDHYLTPTEFSLTHQGSIQRTTTNTPEASIPRQRAVPSPNGVLFVDLLASYGEPDSRVDLGGQNADGLMETVAFCGTPCSYDRIFWPTSSKFVVLGTIESTKPDGTPLCITNADTTSCYIRLTATEYDLTAGQLRTYTSTDHLKTTDLFEEEKSRRWFSDRPPEERVSAGMIETKDLVPFVGKITAMATDVITLTLDDGRTILVSFVSGKVGTKISAVDNTMLGIGATVSGAGLTSGTMGIIATEVTVIKPTDAYVLLPEPAAEVSRSFDLRLSVAETVKEVRVTITDPTGDSIISKKTKPSGDITNGRYEFNIPISLPHSLKTATPLTLTLTPDQTPTAHPTPLTYR